MRGVITVTVAAMLVVAPAGAQAAESPDGPTVVALHKTATGVRVTATPTSGPAAAHRELVNQRDDPRALAVELDSPVRALATPFDPLRQGQWGVSAVGAPAVWPHTTGAGVVVAVLDTGVDGGHEDLRGQVLPGRDVTSRLPEAADTDPNGHGTHLAGIIAATAGNGLGGSGVAPGVRILPVRVLDADGAGFASHVAAGIVWAADNGADIINLSLGGPVASRVQQEAIAYAVGRGVLVVAAAGNAHTDEGPDLPQFPAAFDEVLAVGAVTPSGERATFSTQGGFLDLAGPGTMITSTVPGDDYATFSGTSMASPFVAAVAALVRSVRALSPAELAGVLQGTAVDLGVAGVDPATGAGLVSAERAVASLIGGLAPPAPAAPAAATTPRRVAREVVRVRQGRHVRLRLPAVVGPTYSWSVRTPGTRWRALPVTGATLRTPKITKAMAGVRYRVSAGQAYGVLVLRVIGGARR